MINLRFRSWHRSHVLLLSIVWSLDRHGKTWLVPWLEFRLVFFVSHRPIVPTRPSHLRSLCSGRKRAARTANYHFPSDLSPSLAGPQHRRCSGACCPRPTIHPRVTTRSSLSHKLQRQDAVFYVIRNWENEGGFIIEGSCSAPNGMRKRAEMDPPTYILVPGTHGRFIPSAHQSITHRALSPYTPMRRWLRPG